MIKSSLRNFCFCSALLIVSFDFAGAQTGAAVNQAEKTGLSGQIAQKADKEKAAVAETSRIVAQIIGQSFPELRDARISVKTFDSTSDYFRSRFSFSRFLTFRRLHYIIFVNPQVFEKNAPVEGIRAIIAHELAHAVFYRQRSRFKLLGLARLELKSFTARFERGADLQAIKRGYGAGLREYRKWLNKNIPISKITAKKRDYFSPEEIDLMLEAFTIKPDIIAHWIEKVPRNIGQIQSSINNFMPDEK